MFPRCQWVNQGFISGLLSCCGWNMLHVMYLIHVIPGSTVLQWDYDEDRSTKVLHVVVMRSTQMEFQWIINGVTSFVQAHIYALTVSQLWNFKAITGKYNFFILLNLIWNSCLCTLFFFQTLTWQIIEHLWCTCETFLVWKSCDVFFEVNSLGPSDTIWHWRSWSTLVQVMACCLMAPSHYLNQCWLINSKVLWHSS